MDAAAVVALLHFLEQVRCGLIPDKAAGLRVLGDDVDVGYARYVVLRQNHRLQLTGLALAHHLTDIEVELWEGAGGVAEHACVRIDGEQRSFAGRGTPSLADPIAHALVQLACGDGGQYFWRAFCPELLGCKYAGREL